MKTVITNNYKPTTSTNPVWEIARKVTTRVYLFDYIDPNTGEIIACTKLIWRHNTQDELVHPMYHGCSYRLGGYHPTPCTDWFYGVPLGKMFDWCMNHNLHFIDCVGEYITIDYTDTSYEATHPDF